MRHACAWKLYESWDLGYEHFYIGFLVYKDANLFTWKISSMDTKSSHLLHENAMSQKRKEPSACDWFKKVKKERIRKKEMDG